jgi:hypothetical protein
MFTLYTSISTTSILLNPVLTGDDFDRPLAIYYIYSVFLRMYPEAIRRLANLDYVKHYIL